MSKERRKELFRALHSLLDAVTNLNLRDLEAEATSSSSNQEASTSASASAKGKAKDPDLDWTEGPYIPVSITPLSTKSTFSSVVGSSSESSIVPPSQVPIEAVSLVEQPVNYSPALLAAQWAAMNTPGGQNQGQGHGDPQGPRDGGENGEGNGDGNGDGQGGIMEMLRMGEGRLRWPITTLLKFSQHGTPLPQMRQWIISSRKPLIAVPPRMCSLLLC
jgi:hypothetical protein